MRLGASFNYIIYTSIFVLFFSLVFSFRVFSAVSTRFLTGNTFRFLLKSCNFPSGVLSKISGNGWVYIFASRYGMGGLVGCTYGCMNEYSSYSLDICEVNCQKMKQEETPRIFSGLFSGPVLVTSRN